MKFPAHAVVVAPNAMATASESLHALRATREAPRLEPSPFEIDLIMETTSLCNGQLKWREKRLAHRRSAFVRGCAGPECDHREAATMDGSPLAHYHVPHRSQRRALLRLFVCYCRFIRKIFRQSLPWRRCLGSAQRHRTESVDTAGYEAGGIVRQCAFRAD